MTRRTEGFDKEQTVAGVEERVAARFPGPRPTWSTARRSSPWTATPMPP